MKEQFLEDMRRLWPGGCVSAYQHRDLVRVFAMGWCDALMHAGAADEVLRWGEQFGAIADENWWPDQSWRWWEETAADERG